MKILWNTSFKNTLKQIIWKPLKPMGNFENTLKHIIWKPLKPMGKFENTLKHIFWKPLKPMEKFENTLRHIIWRHFETHHLKTYREIWKHFETDHVKTIETHHWQFLDLINTLLYWKINLAFLYQLMTNSDQYILYQFKN